MKPKKRRKKPKPPKLRIPQSTRGTQVHRDHKNDYVRRDEKRKSREEALDNLLDLTGRLLGVDRLWQSTFGEPYSTHSLRMRLRLP